MHQGPNHWSHLCLGVKGGRLFRICLLTPSQRGRVFRICLTVSKRSPSWKRGLLCGATKWLRIHWNYSLLKRPENVINGLRMWLRALTSQEMILRSWTRTCKKNVRIYVVIAFLFLQYADSILFCLIFFWNISVYSHVTYTSPCRWQSTACWRIFYWWWAWRVPISGQQSC